jgi:hypothetical protein
LNWFDICHITSDLFLCYKSDCINGDFFKSEKWYCQICFSALGKFLSLDMYFKRSKLEHFTLFWKYETKKFNKSPWTLDLVVASKFSGPS